MPRLKGNTKEIILEKALILFSKKGFEAVSIRDIAADTLQEKGLMEEGDTFVYAMELYAPFYLFHFVEHDEDIMDKLMLHAENFSGNFRMK